MFKLVILSILMISVGLALIPHIVYLILKLASLVFRFHVSYRPYGYTAVGLVVVWVLLFGYGHYFGRFFYEISDVELSCKSLPRSFDGYRIVQISDLHLDGWVGKKEKLEEIVRTINDQKPDLIIFTGDLISLDRNELRPFIPVLRTLSAKNGTFSIMGNHDYMPYNRSMSDRERASAVAELQRMQREELGWNLLLNENKTLYRGTDSIAIVGCENKSMGIHNVVSRGDLKKALAGVEDMFHIILTHDPTHWKGEIVANESKTGHASLTFSGHTHSGQFRLFGFSVARFVYDEYDGLYKDGDQQLYVNIGLGGTMPMRVGATPEITVFTLRSE